jgi:DNA polymerase V
LKRIGIRSMKELAHCDRDFLEEEFGVMGLQLHDLANGIDRTDIRKKYVPKESNLSIGQTLCKDYSISGAKLLLREMCDDLALRMRSHQKRANVVSLFVGYSAATGGGFSRQKKLEKPSDDNDTLYHTILEIFDAFIEPFPIRNLGISFGKLSDIGSAEQLDLFEPYSLTLEKRSLNRTLDEIKRRYGQNACLRSSCLLPDSTIIERHGQIGGHKA